MVVEYSRNKYVFKSDFYNIQSDYNSILTSTNGLPKGINELIIKHDNNMGLYILLEELMRTICISLSRNFSNKVIKYVSPLRAIPKRHYNIENSLDDDWNTFNSDQVAKQIKLNPNIIEKLNKWLEKLDINFKGANNIKGSLYSLMVEQKSLKLDLNDVGFGVSQVLPILLNSLLAPKKSIIIIEQPEIHLHPKAQSDLVDFFIDLSKNENKLFLIETHSEYMIKRTRRRMAENHDIDSKSFIAPEKVSILTIENENTSSKIKKSKISDTGSFKWPKDFIDEEDDDLIFLKLQRVKRK